MLNLNPNPHPIECATCFESSRLCTWIVFESSIRPLHNCCDQCARRQLECDWPDSPVTDSNGDIIVGPPQANPYVPGPPNESAAARRARVAAWECKPDKPFNVKFHSSWRDDLFIWNNRGNTPLPPRAPSSKPHPVPPRPTPPRPPKTPKAPNPPRPARESSVPAIVIPETPPPTRPPPQQAPPPIVPVPTPVETPVVPEPVVNMTLDEVVNAFVKRYGKDADTVWFTEKINEMEEIRRVGKFTPKISNFDSTIRLTESMMDTLYDHWAEYDPSSEAECSSRVHVVRKFKKLVAVHFITDPSTDTTDSSTNSSSTDKGKKRTFNQD
ncbi:hypothetical protein DFH28DRAFT_1037859, partial [Melampsora americana]